MNDDSRLDCSDYPCSGCGYPQGDCHCTPELVESAHHSQQQLKTKIAEIVNKYERLERVGSLNWYDIAHDLMKEFRQLSAV